MRSSINVDLHGRYFSVNHRGSEHRFGIPEGYDIRTSDLKEVLDVAHSIVGSDPDHWWEVHHNYKKAPGQYRCHRFTLQYVGERGSLDCFVQWECDAEGYERGHGFRGQDRGEDRFGGIITDQLMEGFLYKVAWNEEDAMENGYVLEGRWLLRVLDDETGALVQMRIPASWNKPPRWKAVALQ